MIRNRLLRGALLGVLLMGGLVLGFVAPLPVAHAESPVEVPTLVGLDVDIRVQRDGSLRVRETQRYDFHARGPATIRRTFARRQAADLDHDRVYEVSTPKATTPGPSRPTVLDVDSAQDDATTTYTVHFPRLPRGARTVTLEYVVRGAVRETPDGLQVEWAVVQDLQVPARRVRVTVAAPAVSWAACTAGRPGSAMPCTATQLGELTQPRFDQVGLDRDQRMVVILGLPSDTGVVPDEMLDRRWSLARAFAVTPTSVGILLGLIALSALAVLLLWWTRGRDAEARQGDHRYDGTEPPDDVRPGQLGTVVDERADVVDLVATVLDLAQRGIVRIEPLDGGDWRLHRAGSGGEGGPREGELRDYELAFVELLFAGGRESVALSELGESFSEGLGQVRDRLYADVVAEGWFAQRPDATRARWTTAGVVLALGGVVLTVVLASFSEFGLVGLGLVLAGAVLAWGAEFAPARTSRGTTLLRKLHRFGEYLSEVDVDSVRPQAAERLLPYAVVFGLEERWLRTARESATLPSDLDAFVRELSGAITAARRVRV